MTASLNEKLRTVKWGDYKLGDLFDIDSTSSFNTDVLVDGNEYDYVTRTSFNQGVLRSTGFVNIENINPAGTWSLGLLQMDFFYRKKPWYAGQFMRKITPKIKVPNGAVLFLTTILNRQKSILLSVLVRDVDRTFKNIMVKIPITNTGAIDFTFMESFVGELEAERVTELSAYLAASGLDNYELSEEELRAIANLKNVTWNKYKMGDLFEKVETKKLPYKAKELPTVATGNFNLPCLTSSFKNQGLNYFAPKQGATILKSVITIPQNSDVYRAYYQSSDFTVLSDAYAIDWIFDKRTLSREQYLFMVVCINKVTDLPLYSYKNKLGGWNIVKDKYILLPQKNGEIDFDFMTAFISAIQKLSIKDVVLFTNRSIAYTKTVVSE